MSRLIEVTPSEGSSDDESQEPITPEAGSEVAESQPIPDKYQGKSVEEVIEMHRNLEKEYGRQSSEVGTYRELVSTLTAANATVPSKEDTTDKPVEVTSDLLFDDPQEAIASVVKQVLNDELAPIRQTQTQQQQQTAIQQLTQEFPDAEAIGADPKFAEFVEKSPYRLQDAQNWVEKQDVESARRLLNDYKEFTGTAEVAAPTQPTAEKKAVASARKASTESGRGGAGASAGKKIMYKNEVMKLIAKNPEKYRSPSFQKELASAIREGRLKD
jgi:hypothetical protein